MINYFQIIYRNKFTTDENIYKVGLSVRKDHKVLTLPF